MNNRDKLRHLVGHWKEHNREHAEAYRKWAEIMGESGDKKALEILNKIADRTIDMNTYFIKLEDLLS